MSDLIDRDELLEDLDIPAETVSTATVRALVKTQKRVDPVKHAHWIPSEDDEHCYLCSNCGENIRYVQYRYCYTCGCRMDEVTE